MGQCLCKKKIDKERATIIAIANLQAILDSKSQKDCAKYIKACVRMDPTGAFCNIKAIEEDTLIHVMLRHTDLFPLNLFLDVANLPDARFDLPGNAGETTLALACKIKDSTFMNIVIDTDIDFVMALTPVGVANMPKDLEELEIGTFSSCLDYAIENGFVEHVKTLMSSEITWPFSYLKNALRSLTKDGDKKPEILEIILTESDEALIHDPEAANLLLWGIQNDQKDLLAILLDFVGLNINCRDAAGRTALHFACAGGDLKTIELLLKNGAALAELDKRGDSPLHCVIRSSDDPIIRKKLLPRLLSSTAGKSMITHKNKAGEDCMDILEEMRPHLKPKEFQSLVSSLQNAISNLKEADKIEPTSYEESLLKVDEVPTFTPAKFILSPELAEKLRNGRSDSIEKVIDWEEGDQALALEEASASTVQPSIKAPEQARLDFPSLIDPELIADDLLGKYILDKNPDTTEEVSCGRFVLDGQEIVLYYNKKGKIEAKMISDGEEIYGTIEQTVGRNVALTMRNKFWTGTASEISENNECINIEWEDGALWRKIESIEATESDVDIEDEPLDMQPWTDNADEEQTKYKMITNQEDVEEIQLNTAIATTTSADISEPDAINLKFLENLEEEPGQTLDTKEDADINSSSADSGNYIDTTPEAQLQNPEPSDISPEAQLPNPETSNLPQESIKEDNIDIQLFDNNSDSEKEDTVSSASLSLNTEELNAISSGSSSDI